MGIVIIIVDKDVTLDSSLSSDDENEIWQSTYSTFWEFVNDLESHLGIDNTIFKENGVMDTHNCIILQGLLNAIDGNSDFLEKWEYKYKKLREGVERCLRENKHLLCC